MAEKEVKLLGMWPSPFVNRVRIALKLKSINYDFMEEKFGSKSDLLLKSNPVHKKVPVLIHGDKTICESLVIVEYIDEVWNNGTVVLLPSDPHDRAIARFWAAYVDEKWYPFLKEIRMSEGEEAEIAIKKAVAGLGLLEETFVECSKGKPFFGGDTIGYLDIALGCFLGWLRVAEQMGGARLLEDAKMPGLVGWAERFWSENAIKEVMPETEKLMEVAKILKSMANK